MLGNEGKVRIQGVVEESGGQETSGSRDEGRCGALGLLGCDETAGENPLRGRDLGGGISVDVDVVQGLVVLEEELPKGCEMKISVGEEEERDLWLGVAGPEVGYGGVVS